MSPHATPVCDRLLTREASVDRGTRSYVRQHLCTTMNRPRLRPNNKAEQGTTHCSKHTSPFQNGVPNSKVHTATRTFDTSFKQSSNQHITVIISHTIHVQAVIPYTCKGHRPFTPLPPSPETNEFVSALESASALPFLPPA